MIKHFGKIPHISKNKLQMSDAKISTHNPIFIALQERNTR
jgi:hypothetical protein